MVIQGSIMREITTKLPVRGDFVSNIAEIMPPINTAENAIPDDSKSSFAIMAAIHKQKPRPMNVAKNFPKIENSNQKMNSVHIPATKQNIKSLIVSIVTPSPLLLSAKISQVNTFVIIRISGTKY